jgi:D-inositol-3-phosphate glycosyltransferase
MKRLAILSLHTSPLAQPGTGDGGGMNVYVRELAAALARAGNTCDVFTRATSPSELGTVVLEPGLAVHGVQAGPLEPMAKEDLELVVPEFTDRVLTAMTTPSGAPIAPELGGPFHAVHANYWLSGIAGHTIKHELDLPLVSTFHTLDRVKAEAMPEEDVAGLSSRRAEAESVVIGCSDAVLASCEVELDQLVELYDADPSRVAIVPPGVDHAFFGPGDRAQARRALGLPEEGALVLFVGRLQPLKGASTALRAFAELRRRGVDAHLAICGGPSGPGGEATVAELHRIVDEEGLKDRVHFRPPQPHELLSTYYRAADVTVVPSRSESFGLVALESMACGTPVVAAAVGGLTTLVLDGETGSLIEGVDPIGYADAIGALLADPLSLASASLAAALDARRYTWASAAARLGTLFDELVEARLVSCG